MQTQPPFIRLFLFATLAATSATAGTKVDLSMPGRNDSVHPAFERWFVADGPSATNSFADVGVTIRGVGGPLQSTWWKPGAVTGARLVIDGVTTRDDANASAVEVELRGLAPGPHSFVAYLNEMEGGGAETPARVNVFVNGVQRVAGVRPGYRVAHDDDAQTAYVEFEVAANEAVVIRFAADAGDRAATRRRVVLNGFEIDGSDPARRATRPFPIDQDEHVDADGGRLTLRWQSPVTAVAHEVYFGTSRQAVTAATTDAAEFRGRQSAASFTAEALTNLDEYYWRIDEVDAGGRTTRGETWRFRPRHLAFPGAEGYGRFARGGRAGRVFIVTNLNDSGPGSLREAVEAEGPRTVVFDVGGLITLESKLIVRNQYLTVAGQTAPGKGITLRKYNFGILGSQDIVIRHIRVRPGNIAGITLDGMGMAASDHCIFDHCSISWTIDEAFSSRGARNITLQRVLISEALNEAGHKNYPPGSRHGYAASIGGMVGSFHHNLLAHNSGRNWSLAGGLDQAGRHTAWLDIRNNVVFNWDNRTTDGGAARVNFVNNYYKPGPASRVFHLLKPERNNIAGFGPQDYYVAGNVMEGHVTADDRLGGVVEPNPRANRRGSGDGVLDHDDARPTRFEALSEFIVDEPFFESFVTTHSAAEAYENVLADVGCTVPMLDDHDRRVIEEVRAGRTTFKGSRSGLPGLPDSQEDVGGWEDYPEVHRPADWDVDRDGMPGAWEVARGLNPNDAADSALDPDGDGYTNLEDYLNELTQ